MPPACHHFFVEELSSMTGEDREDVKTKVGDAIRKLRQARGYSQKYMVEYIRANYEVKLDASYLSRMERGRVEIPLRTLYAIASCLDVSPGILLDPDLKEGKPHEHASLFENHGISSNLRILYSKLGVEETTRQIRRWLDFMIDYSDELEKNQRIRAANSSNEENAGEKT